MKAVGLLLLTFSAGRMTLSGCVGAARQVHQSAKEIDFPLKPRTEVWRVSSSSPANSIFCWNHWCGSLWGLKLQFWTQAYRFHRLSWRLRVCLKGVYPFKGTGHCPQCLLQGDSFLCQDRRPRYWHPIPAVRQRVPQEGKKKDEEA